MEPTKRKLRNQSRVMFPYWSYNTFSQQTKRHLNDNKKRRIWTSISNLVGKAIVIITHCDSLPVLLNHNTNSNNLVESYKTKATY